MKKKYLVSDLPLPLTFIAFFGVLSIIAAGQGLSESAKQFAVIGMLVLAGRFLSESGVSVTLLVGLVAVVFSTALLSSCPSCNSGGIWGWMAFIVTATNVVLLVLGRGIWSKVACLLASFTLLAEVMLGLSTDKFCISCILVAAFHGLVLWTHPTEVPRTRSVHGITFAAIAAPVLLFSFMTPNHLEIGNLKGVSFALISRSVPTSGKVIGVLIDPKSADCSKLEAEFQRLGINPIYLTSCSTTRELNCVNLRYMVSDKIYPSTFLIQNDKIIKIFYGYASLDIEYIMKWLQAPIVDREKR